MVKEETFQVHIDADSKKQRHYIETRGAFAGTVWIFIKILMGVCPDMLIQDLWRKRQVRWNWR